MRKKYCSALFALLLAISSMWGLSGCSNGEEAEGSYVFYLNLDMTRIVPSEYEIKGTTQQEQIEELLDALSGQPDSMEMQRTIPQNVQVNEYSANGYRLLLDFSEEYYEMSATQEVLVRAAIVRTMVQTEGIAYVNFTVNGESLVNVQGRQVGSMNGDSFVENPGQQINSSQEAILTLYFANASGDRLVRETRNVHYSSNISLEKLVMEQLIEGPKSSGMKATLSADARLINVSVVDNVCYINLDDSIKNKNSEVTEEVLLYSIVDSLTELSGVDKVQISIDGDMKGKLRYVYDLSTMYENDFTYLEGYSAEDTEKE